MSPAARSFADVGGNTPERRLRARPEIHFGSQTVGIHRGVENGRCRRHVRGGERRDRRAIPKTGADVEDFVENANASPGRFPQAVMAVTA